MDFNRHDATRFCKVIGEKGTLHWNIINGTIKFFGKILTSGNQYVKKF